MAKKATPSVEDVIKDNVDETTLATLPNTEHSNVAELTAFARRIPLMLISCGCDAPTVALSMAIWEKKCPDADVRFIEANDYRSALIDFIADDSSPMVAAFVPASTFPVSPISIADLEVLKSFALNADRIVELDELNQATKGMYKMMGKSDYIPRELPIVYDKLKLAEMIAKFDISDDSVNIPTLYASFVNRAIPFDASIATSKITGLVARSNPNMDVVSGYFNERKFVVATPVGFEAIKEQLAMLLL